MYSETINTEEAIHLFQSIMRVDSHNRILFLEGASKMGKSHLLSKVFPILASQQYQARCVTIDLKRQPLTILDILHTACEDLGEKLCPAYQNASKERMKHTKADVVIERALTLGSKINVSVTSQDTVNDFQLWCLHLTKQFVNDVGQLCNSKRPIVFLIDNVNCATDTVQVWLMDTLLKQLAKLTDVRIVIAGQSLPEANAAYIASCKYHQLFSITELGAYVVYCSNIKINLLEETIQVIAVLSDYSPGYFIENLLRIRLAKLI